MYADLDADGVRAGDGVKETCLDLRVVGRRFPWTFGCFHTFDSSRLCVHSRRPAYDDTGSWGLGIHKKLFRLR